MLLVNEDHPNSHTRTTVAHKIRKATIRIPRLISTEEGEANHNHHMHRGMDIHHSHLVPCRIGSCLPLMSSTLIGTNQSSLPLIVIHPTKPNLHWSPQLSN